MSATRDPVAAAAAAWPAVRALDLDARLGRAAASRAGLQAAGDHIVAVAAAETTATPGFARRELASALLFADALPDLAQAIRPREVPARTGRTRLHFEPYGVVFGWHAANSPIWVPTLVALSALVGGNTVIGRPSRRASRTTRAVLEAISASWPHGAVQVADLDPAAAEALIVHPGVGSVIAPASTETCRRHLGLLAAAYADGAPLRPYIPEASGNDACVVLAGADLAAAAQAIALGGFANAGQLCMAAKRVIVDRAVWPSLEPALAAAIARITRDGVHRTEVQTGTSAGDQGAAAIADAMARGGRFVVGGPARDGVVAATLIALEAAEATGAVMWRDEVFAPVRCVVVCDGVDEALALANASRYGLGAALFGGTPAERESFTRGVRAARVVVDEGPLYQDPHLVVGGVADSGYGGARPKLEQLVWAKRVHVAAG